jgi:hypothetical protein
MAFRDAFEEPREVVIDALRRAFFAHFVPAGGFFT